MWINSTGNRVKIRFEIFLEHAAWSINFSARRYLWLLVSGYGSLLDSMTHNSKGP